MITDIEEVFMQNISFERAIYIVIITLKLYLQIFT